MTSADWARKDFYATLGVKKDAGADEIKKAYRRLARENHPDSNPGDTAKHDRFKEVAEAYDVLGDPERRKQYDQMRSMPAGFGGFPGGAGGAGGAGAGGGFDLNDFLREQGGGGGGLGDLFGGLFGGGRARGPQPGPRRGADLEAEATVNFTDAVEGATISLRLSSDAPCGTCNGTGGKPGTTPKICPTCDGAGMVAASTGGAFTLNETCPRCAGRQLTYDEPCPTCLGSGRGSSSRTIQARIPAGVKDGQRIRLRGKGAAGERGGSPGDLFVTVKVTPHRLFGRSGDNLTLTVPVSFDEAALGADIRVPTLSGPTVTLKIPPGTPNGRTFRVRGKGLAGKDGRGVARTGDLLVTVEVHVPATLNAEARAAVEAYREATAGSDLRSNLTGGA